MSTTKPIRSSSEAAMYVAWQRLAQPAYRFDCRDGQKCMVVSPGLRNEGPGPDFSGAVLLLDGELRVGPVEMHRSEEEWFTHGHQEDRLYDRVILHVVEAESRSGERRTGLPTLVLPSAPDSSTIGRDRIGRSGGESRAELMHQLAELSWERFLNRSTAYLHSRGEILSARNLLVPIFDALGYSANRGPMRRTAERFLQEEPKKTAKEVLEQVIRSARLPRRTERALAERFGLESSDPAGLVDEEWNFALRLSNRPEVRVVAGAVLIDRLFRTEGIREIRNLVRASDSPRMIADRLIVRAEGFSFLGSQRAGAIVINVLLPALLADGIRRRDEPLILGACRAYRHHPSLGTNRTLREFTRRFGAAEQIRGAFFQQGVHEYMSRTG